MTYRIVSFILIVSTLGCNQSKPSEEDTSDQMVVVEIPEDFPDFYSKFHQDSLYQLEHIIFPLPGKTETSSWQKNQWIMHKPFDNSSGEFTRDLNNMAGIITETIGHTSGYFRMVRRFSKFSDEWNLFYYEVHSIGDSFQETMKK